MKGDLNNLTAYPLTFDLLHEGYSSWSNSEHLPDFILAYDNQNVIIRGFLYSTGNDGWILASEPNLKSCCVGASEKRGLQLSVKGSLPEESPRSALLVQGTLKITPGALKPFYALEQASISEEPLSLSIVWIVAFACVCCLTASYFWRRSSKLL
ncbi:MAG: hypothetical protein H0T62_09835 [Parachlamydiaceae bacterium]|nr:hypothetical protein [Parachlamydiaceae bacterium]